MNYSFLNYLYQNCTSFKLDKTTLNFYFINRHDWPDLMDAFRACCGPLQFMYSVSTDFTLTITIGLKSLFVNYPNLCKYEKS